MPPPPPRPPQQPLPPSARGGASGLLDAKAMADDFLSTLQSSSSNVLPSGAEGADTAEEEGGGREAPSVTPSTGTAAAGLPVAPTVTGMQGSHVATAAARAPGLAGPSSSVGQGAAGIPVVDRPLDLFKAIFEAEEDEEEDEWEEEKDEAAAKLQVAGGEADGITGSGGGEAIRQTLSASDGVGSKPSGGGGGTAGGGTVGPAKALADALLRAQQLSSTRAEEARAARSAHAAVQGLPTVLPATQAVLPEPGGASQDPAMQERILSALAALRGIKKGERKEKRGKKEKREKEKKSKKHSKHSSKGEGMKKSKKHKEPDGHKKKRSRRDDSSGGDGSGSDGNSSDDSSV